MFSFYATEQVYSQHSKLKLRFEAILYFILSGKYSAKFFLFIISALSFIRILDGFPSKYIARKMSCSNSIQDIKKIITHGYQQRLYSCLQPVGSTYTNEQYVFKLLDDIKKVDVTGFSHVMIKAEDFIDPRVLKLVSSDGLLNKQDGEQFTKFSNFCNELCLKASTNGVSIVYYTMLSSCSSALQAITQEFMAKYNTENVTVFQLFQLCHANSLQNIVQLVQSSNSKGFTPGIAIAKYMSEDYHPKQVMKKGPNELDRDFQNNYVCKSYQLIKRTFYEVSKYLLNNIDNLSIFIISHNLDNLLYLASLMESMGISPTCNRIVISQRYGMTDHISSNLAARGYRTAQIVPLCNNDEFIGYLRNLYLIDPSLTNIFAEKYYSIRKELRQRKFEYNN